MSRPSFLKFSTMSTTVGCNKQRTEDLHLEPNCGVLTLIPCSTAAGTSRRETRDAPQCSCRGRLLDQPVCLRPRNGSKPWRPGASVPARPAFPGLPSEHPPAFLSLLKSNPSPRTPAQTLPPSAPTQEAPSQPWSPATPSTMQEAGGNPMQTQTPPGGGTV